jgi:hypothetical protein
LTHPTGQGTTPPIDAKSSVNRLWEQRFIKKGRNFPQPDFEVNQVVRYTRSGRVSREFVPSASDHHASQGIAALVSLTQV